MARRPIAKPGKDPQPIFDRAVAALERGDFKAAAQDAKRLVKMVPQSADVWQLQATALLEGGRPQEALKSLRRGLTQVTGHPGLFDLLGTAHMHLGHPDQAASSYRKALAAAADDPGILNNLGNALREAGLYEDACDAYSRSLQARPGHADTAFNHGNALALLRRHDEAEAAFRLALAAVPDDPVFLLNLGEALIQLRRLEEALEVFVRLDDMGAHDESLFNNMATTLMGLGRIEEAYGTLDRGLAFGGDDPKFIGKMSVFLFLQNRWKEGWEAFESRFAAASIEPRPFPHPWWQGESLTDKRILVWGEMGLGDEIMAASMIPDLVNNGAGVMLECDPRLTPVFSRSFPDIQVIARADPPADAIDTAEIDVQSPIYSLARWVRADEDSFPANTVFLHADRERTQMFRARYRDDSGLPLIGITWASANPNIGDTKSMALDTLTPVLRVPGARFVDLQYGDTVDERRAFEQQTGCLLIHDDDINPAVDFDGHLAQVAAMDLIISISNTTVHAAGAMGVQVWTMIRHVADRRWLLDREDSPWYGSVRLFRQPEPEDWTSVVQRVSEELPGYLAELSR